MASNTIATISRLDLRDLSTPASASITDVQNLSSYNWIEAPQTTPTIAVPGSPDLWSPPKHARPLKKDTGSFYIAQNAARHPDSPLEPLFRALYVSHPTFDICSIDIVTDQNNIRKLLSFVNPRSSRDSQEEFTIKIEVENNTAIFCRDETETRRYIAPNEFKGFGHTFEKTYTRRQVSGSTGHHRIISYDFGGLRFILRHKTDGYVGASGTKPTTSASKKPSANKKPEVDDLSSILGTLSLSPESSASLKIHSTDSKVVIRMEGQEVPLASTVEIKTRVIHKPISFEEVVVQLWASQTPKLVRAYHRKGLFEISKVEDVVVQVKAWEDQNQKELRLLAGLIRKIRDVVRVSGGRSVMRYDTKGDRLVFHKLEGERMLPNDIYGKWEVKGNHEEGAVSEVDKTAQPAKKGEIT